MTREAYLARRIYPPAYLAQAVELFRDECVVRVLDEDADGCRIQIDCRSDEPHFAHEFLNQLLQLSIEAHLGAQGRRE